MPLQFVLRLSSEIVRPYLNESKIQSNLSKIASVLFPSHLERVILDLVVVEDQEMISINKERRGKNRTTDVLSFPMIDLSLPIPEQELGEIVISVNELERQAKEIDHSETDEFYRLLVHGFLHCLGFDHETNEEDAEAMREKEDECLALVFDDLEP